MDIQRYIEDIKQCILIDADIQNAEAVRSRIYAYVEALEALSTLEKIELCTQAQYAILGYGPIQPLLDDEGISEIMINGIEALFVERAGRIERIPHVISTRELLMQFIHKIATEVGREVNLGSPILDARLRDGSRVNVILDPVSVKGPTVTIRKFKQAFGHMDLLIDAGMVMPACAAFLERLVKSKYNIFICGGTGSGKTTLLNCLAAYIGQNERLVTIEDAAEIKIEGHPHVISLETRKSHQSDRAIPIATLIKNALRMRPDRIIVGEVRGEEVVDMLQAMNTGHEGSFSTGHSNSDLDMLTRLEAIACGNSSLHHEIVRRQIISAIDILIFVSREPDGSRRLKRISELKKGAGTYELNTLYRDEEMCTESVEKALGHMEAQLRHSEKYRRAKDAKLF